jgi:hypothetical protein
MKDQKQGTSPSQPGPSFMYVTPSEARWKQGGLGVLIESRKVRASLVWPRRLEQEPCFSGRGHCFPGIEFFLHCITSCFVLLKKPDAKINIGQLGHQPSGHVSRHSLPEWVSPFVCLVSSVLPQVHSGQGPWRSRHRGAFRRMTSTDNMNAYTWEEIHTAQGECGYIMVSAQKTKQVNLDKRLGAV